MIKHLLAFNTQTELSPYLAVDLIAKKMCNLKYLNKNNKYFWKGRFPKLL